MAGWLSAPEASAGAQGSGGLALDNVHLDAAPGESVGNAGQVPGAVDVEDGNGHVFRPGKVAFQGIADDGPDDECVLVTGIDPVPLCGDFDAKSVGVNRRLGVDDLCQADQRVRAQSRHRIEEVIACSGPGAAGDAPVLEDPFADERQFPALEPQRPVIDLVQIDRLFHMVGVVP
jgi:hypothetical protein